MAGSRPRLVSHSAHCGSTAGPLSTGSVTMSANSSLGSNAGTGTINGVVSGAFALTKVGAGILALGGSNTYSGGTTVANGSLQLNNNNAANTQPISVVAGGTIGNAHPGQWGGVTVANAINIVGNTSEQRGRARCNRPGTGLGDFHWPDFHYGQSDRRRPLCRRLTPGNVLVLNGVITSTVGLSQRDGFVRYGGSGTGYTSLTVTNNAQVGATDGISTAAAIILGGSGNATLDLNGFNQTLASVSVGNAANAFAGTVNLGAEDAHFERRLHSSHLHRHGAARDQRHGGRGARFWRHQPQSGGNDNPALDDLTVNAATITGTGGVTKTARARWLSTEQPWRDSLPSAREHWPPARAARPAASLRKR